MRDWKKEFHQRFVKEQDIFNGDKIILGGKPLSKPDEVIEFIEQILSERDKEIIQIVKNMGRLGLNEHEKDWNAMLSWVVGELENELKTLNK